MLAGLAAGLLRIRGPRSRHCPALGEQREGAKERRGRGGRLWERGLFRGSGAELLRSPRFASSLGCLGARGEALCVCPCTWFCVHACVCMTVPPGWQTPWDGNLAKDTLKRRVRWSVFVGNRWDFSGCGVHTASIRINPARCQRAGDASRFSCLQTHRPATRHKVASRARQAAGGGGASGEAGRPAPSGQGTPRCPAVPSSPHCLWMLRKPTRPSPPAAKTESKFAGRGSPNFLRCKFAAETRRRLWAVGEEGEGQPAERGPWCNAREGASPLFLADTVAKVPRTSRLCRRGLHPGGVRWLSQSCRKSFRRSVRAQLGTR
ncbi:uncharacterized protein LOC123652360 isoform X1 [Pipistrellus kuhlii]|uniref:uncharacterized protein LOC123652360 isoform X1 n=1 Tax=Pipistrellus kuhlii TaxID=59472 RepID=UPI001E26F215|nr:uncharacterized protein LOC123652360 isoform X1 [Pipistrellus kuhlii]